MSSPIDAILAALLARSAPAQMSGQMPDPKPLPPEDNIVSPDPSQPRSPDERMEGFRRIITNFTYSLGSGLTAASQNARGRGQRNQSGMGAILQVPMELQRAQEALKLRQEQEERQKQQLVAQLIGQKQQGDYQTQQIAETQRLRQVQEANATENARHNLATEAAKASDDDATLRAKGFKRDAEGKIIPVPREELSETERAKIQRSENLDALTEAQTELADATTELRKVQADTSSDQYRLAQERLAVAQKNAATARERLGISQENLDVRKATFEATGGISPERQKMQANAQSGLRAIEDFRAELKKPGTLQQLAIPGSIGARKARNARNEMVDVLTRLRTGAALNKEEQAFYRDQAPGLLDAIDAAMASGEEDVIEYKLRRFEDEFKALAGPNAVSLPNRDAAGTPAVPPIELERGPDGKLRVKAK